MENYKFSSYNKPRELLLPHPSKTKITNHKKGIKFRIISSATKNGLQYNSSLPNIHKASITDNDDRKDLIERLQSKIKYLSDEIKSKNGKIDEMNKFINSIKQNNDLSAAFLIKSQEQMIITLTEQNNLLRKEIKENNYKYAQKTNELLSTIAHLKDKKIPLSNDKNILTYHLIESFSLISSNEHSLLHLPLKFVSDDEVNINKYILSLYLKSSNTTRLFDYLSKENFSFDDFIDLIYKTISKYHWKTSQDHFNLTRLIVELSNNRGELSKEILRRNIQAMLLQSISSATPSFSISTQKIDNIITAVNAYDIFHTNLISVSSLKNILSREEIDEDIILYLVSTIKEKTLNEDESIFAIRIDEIESLLSHSEIHEEVIQNFVNSIFKTAINDN